MKIKSKVAYLMSFVSLLGGLSACGTRSNALEVIFWSTFGSGIDLEIKDKAEEFEDYIYQKEGVRVRINLSYQGGYDDVLTKVNNGYAVGNVPTITIAYPDHVAEYLQLEQNPGDFVVKLDDLMNDPEIGFNTEPEIGDTVGVDDIVQGFYNEGTQYIREGTYSLPLMKSTEIMFYNKDFMERTFEYYNPAIRGDAIETFISTMTWDDLMDIAAVAKEHMRDISATLEVPVYYDSDSNLFITQLIQEGLDFIKLDDDGKGDIAFNTPEAREIVQELREAYTDGLLYTRGSNQNLYGSDFFKEGKCLFTIGSSGGAGYNSPAGGSFDPVITKVPARNENPVYVSQGPTVCLLKNVKYNASRNEQLINYGWRFIKYILTPQANVDICLASSGYVPVRTSAYATEDYTAYTSDDDTDLQKAAKVVIEDVAGKYISTPVFKGSATARDEGGNIITQALLNPNRSLTTIFETAVNEIRLKM